MSTMLRRLVLLACLTALAAPAAARAADPVIAAAGDIACGPAGTGVFPCQQAATASLLAFIHPTAVLSLGDNQYNSGTLADYNAFYDPTWGALKAITHPVVGNHEYGSPNATGYFDYFNGAGRKNGPAGPRPDGYYSFNVGTWHLIALNSNCERVTGGCAAGSPQETWLRNDLKAHPAACTLAFEHQPLWASPAFATPDVQPLFQDLYDAGAALLITGHDHIYQRFAPSAPDQSIDRTRGLRHVILGTGGRDLSGLGPPIPNSQAVDNDTFGVLKLTLHPASYDWQFLPIAGQSFTDSGTGFCPGASAPPAPPDPSTPPATPPTTTPGPVITQVPSALIPNPPAASPPEADENPQSTKITTVLGIASVVRGRRRLVIRGRMTTGA